MLLLEFVLSQTRRFRAGESCSGLGGHTDGQSVCVAYFIRAACSSQRSVKRYVRGQSCMPATVELPTRCQPACRGNVQCNPKLRAALSVAV